jgi:hypothetical protein
MNRNGVWKFAAPREEITIEMRESVTESKRA